MLLHSPPSGMNLEAYHSLVDWLPVLLYRCAADRQRTWLFVSEGGTAVTGCTASNLLQSQPLSQLVHPVDRPRVEAMIYQCLMSRRPFELEYRLRRANGSYGWVLDRGQGVYSQRGQLLEVVGMLLDISQRKQTEQAMLRRDAQYRLLGELTANYFFSFQVNPDGSLENEWPVRGGGNWLQSHGLSRFPQGLREWLLLVHPQDRLLVEQFVQLVIATRRASTLEYRLMPAEGTVRWVRERLQPEWDGLQQRVVRLFGVAEDITERKQSEEQLQASEQRYQALVGQIPGVIFQQIFSLADQNLLVNAGQKNAPQGSPGQGSPASSQPAPARLTIDQTIDQLTSGKFKFVGDKLQELCGYPATDFTAPPNRQWREMIDAQDWQRIVPTIAQALEQQQPYTVEYRITDVDGQPRWILERGQGTFGADGQVLSVGGVLLNLDRQQFHLEVQPDASGLERLGLSRQTQREQLIGAIALRIRKSLKLEEILQATVNEVRQFFQADRVVITCCHTDGVYHVVAESAAPGWRSFLGLSMREDWFYERLEFYRQGYYEIVHDLTSQALSGDLHAWMERWQIKSRLALPILFGKQFWGIIAIHQCSGNRNWQAQEIALLEQLATQVAIAIQQAELYRRLQVANRELEQLAFLDSLTQISNRRRFDEYLEREWRRLRRENSFLSLVLCDVDYFKRYNDTYGHPQGDECLQQIARVLQQVTQRPADLAARYGGEEFALILPATAAMGAVQVVQSIQERVRNLRILNINTYITLSFGIASTVPTEATSPQQLIATADSALYQAKSAGRNRYVIRTV